MEVNWRWTTTSSINNDSDGKNERVSVNQLSDMFSNFRRFLAGNMAKDYAILPLIAVAGIVLSTGGTLQSIFWDIEKLIPNEEIWDLSHISVNVIDPGTSGKRFAQFGLVFGSPNTVAGSQRQSLTAMTGNWTLVNQSSNFIEVNAGKTGWSVTQSVFDFAHNALSAFLPQGANSVSASLTTVTMPDTLATDLVSNQSITYVLIVPLGVTVGYATAYFKRRRRVKSPEMIYT